MEINFDNGKITLDLERGVKGIESVKFFTQPGHKCNSLDGIVPPAVNGGKVSEIERLTRHIEDLGERGARAYTVTFTDKMLSTYREEYLEREIRMLTKKTRGVIDFEYVCEYSATGRFHLHGCVLVKDVKVLANLNRKYSKFGICKCKVIDNSEGWSDYVLKQHRYTKE